MTDNNNLIRLDANKLAGLDLDELAPYPDEIVLSGKSEHQTHHFYHGELLVATYQAALKIDPNDEDTQHNLKVARRSLLDNLEVLPSFFLSRWWNGLRGSTKRAASR